MSHSVRLSDKYDLPAGRVFMTGTQALVRMLLAQKARDEAAGLNTEGFVSGYRGSPLGGLDLELWKNKARLTERKIRFEPGLNEELAATAIWGTQMLALDPKARVDGVFSLWYGKGPGVDRCGDVFKHGNIAGCAPKGGVLLVAGDDHSCKSSSLPHQSEHALIASMIPVLAPADLKDFIEFGLHGYAMSRYSGCWVGYKVVSDTVESSGSLEIDPLAIDIQIPDSYPIPPDGFSIRWPDPPLVQENRLQRERLYALLEYVRVNRLNRQDWSAPQARLGIVTAGKSYLDVREALKLLALNEDDAATLGLRLLKVGVVWPLEPQCVVEFAQGLEEILVVEEKRQVLEYQIKEHLYNEPDRPRVVGKYDDAGEWVKVPSQHILLSPNGELNPAVIADAIARRLERVLGRSALPAGVIAWLGEGCAAMRLSLPADPNLPQRVPYFCSGCPHNTSTRVPEGSRALAGIGCHYLVQGMDRRTETFSQMGGEGATWIGTAPFTDTPHVFANLGDGTYMHSGSLAIRAAVAAKVNITYKLLVNDAVAMTGGQPVEGAPSVPQLMHQLAAEGVRELHLVSDEPENFSLHELPPGSHIAHRDNMDALQRQLREVKGVSAIVYVQTCATEKRRRRKAKKLADPARRVVINEAVCEGCGDCGVQSNCVSILPLETELGRKRVIDQSSCNKDSSCVNGFCPSFVTVQGAELRKPDRSKIKLPENLPEPALPGLAQPCNILVAGVGGTGVVTIGAILGMAAHIEGKGVRVLDMAGLAQKGGAVQSHVRLAATPEELHATRVPRAQADLILGCDLMTSAGTDPLATLSNQRTRALMNTDVAPTGAFTRNPDWQASPEGLLERVRGAVMELAAVDATRLATALLGDAVASNMFMLGYAWQKGWIPLQRESLTQAIELNGTAVAMNQGAFAWGRQAALDLEAVRVAAGIRPAESVMLLPNRLPSLAHLLSDRGERLSAYQDAAYAHRYRRFVSEIARLEQSCTGGDRFAREVAVSLYKLMAYKDEYEVARLHVETGFFERIKEQFDGKLSLRFHLAPPLLARKDERGHLVKKAYGPGVAVVFKALARLKGLRGTPFDPFGYTAERRDERQAIRDFESLVCGIAIELDDERMPLAMELARLPQTVKGFGHVRERNARAATLKQAELMRRWASHRKELQAA
ncbi:indolepyruvate ferredoxin oxidoreductase family protein [Pelomonas sp. KK5]|uniref:indolepyruvate ferredoxin oxidoreductase family protein n=1 Tax=Pelomonas sp. KK5 TaxID=1855730 RepID=UPI00097BFF37|nr:indolepyruvate ferredoxin oxidoreductase family protein [Pelomonas sp. KK5]